MYVLYCKYLYLSYSYKESILGVRLRSFWFLICYRRPKNKKYVFFYFSPFSYLGVKTAFKVMVEKSFLWKKLTFWKSGASVIFRIQRHNNSSIDTIPLSLIVLEIYHKNYFSTLTLNAVFTPQIWKRGKIKKHVFLIFRSSITYPKIEMITEADS